MVIIRIAMSRVMLLCFVLMPVWQASAVWAQGQSPGAPGHSWQKEVVAKVGAVQGDTKVQRGGEAKFKKIGAKSPLYILDYVATGKTSKLWWQGTFNAYSPSDKWKPGPDVTHGSLAADSVFGFKEFERAGASYRFVGYVQKGTVRFIKSLPNTNPPSTFTIGTHTAWIEVLSSDRAADFIVQSKNESVTTVTVLWGKVRVRNSSPEIKGSRVLTSCQEVDVERDQEPGEIKWVSTDTMKELVKRTTIPKTLPEDVPSCERLKTEVLLDVTAVFLPPPGVVLYPPVVPTPVPVPVPGDKSECCPPGQIYNPRTGECRCPCPEGQLPPVVVPRDGNGLTVIGQCGSCRQGATFNPQTCSCECPCPQGFLLPGQGCVPQCPEGYSQGWDSSASPPYRCLYCLPTGVVTDPIPPPLRQCENSEQCGPCEECVDGSCLPVVCSTGFYLDRVSCDCRPITNFISQPCTADAECPVCQKCQGGQCRSQITCPPEAKLNPDTCKCESVNGSVRSPHDPSVPSPPPPEHAHPVVPEAPEVQNPRFPECQNDSDCPEGEACYGESDQGRGTCRKPPPRPRSTVQSVEKPQCRKSIDCPIGQVCRKGKCVSEDAPSGESPAQDTQVGPFPGGVGAPGRIRVGPGTPSQQVAPVQRVPRQVAPVQRVPRAPVSKPR